MAFAHIKASQTIETISSTSSTGSGTLATCGIPGTPLNMYLVYCVIYNEELFNPSEAMIEKSVIDCTGIFINRMICKA